MDGQSKVTNRIIIMYLRCLAGDRPRSWLQWLPLAEFCFNTLYQSTLWATPFEIVYGCEPLALMSYMPGVARVVDRIHDVFHISLLKKYLGDLPTSPVPLPAILRGRMVLTPQLVRARLNHGQWQLLVH